MTSTTTEPGLTPEASRRVPDSLEELRADLSEARRMFEARLDAIDRAVVELREAFGAVAS